LKAEIGVSLSPETPIASLLEAYLKAIVRENLVPDIIIEAIQSLPLNNLSATFKNLYLFYSIVDLKLP